MMKKKRTVMVPDSNKELWKKCKNIARKKSVLSLVTERVHTNGLIGEVRNIQLTYLALTSRLLAKPVSIAIKGPSSCGKSAIVREVLRLFPETAYLELTALSDKALLYLDDQLRHRMLVVYEAEGMTRNTSYYLRQLLSEGTCRYKTLNGKQSVEKNLRGPTGLITTTTSLALHAENETRFLSSYVDDTPAHTRKVLVAKAKGKQIIEQPPEDWHAYQLWQTSKNNKVQIPYKVTLAKLINPLSVRLRRDFDVVTSLIEAHALLHRKTRKTNADGNIIASLKDYRVVYGLIQDLIADGAEASIPKAVSDVTNAVQTLSQDGTKHVTQMMLKSYLQLDKSTISRRVRDALERGCLRDLSNPGSREMRLIKGELPTREVEILPSPDELANRLEYLRKRCVEKRKKGKKK